MQAIHRTLLEVNEEFLVAETPVTPFLEALLNKHVLNDLDLQQLSSLEPQGPRAVKRFVLHVLPLRGPLAYPSLLEALQEAQAQHLVDLLLEGEAVLSAAVKPIELPDVPEAPKRPREDPNEYARKLTANKDLIEDVVSPEHVIPPLLQNGVMTSLEEGLLESVQGQHVLTWTVLWGVVLQRGLRAYHAFMGALLQNGYSALFHTIEETKVTGVEAMKSTLHRNMMAANTVTLPPDNHHNHHSNNDAPELPFSTREVEAGPPPPLRATSQQSAFSGKGREALPSITPRSHASPLQPGYSQGDLDLLYTPRTNLQVKESGPQDPAQTSRSADLLYNPTWTDPYNHLRGADVASPYSVYRRNSPFGALENDSARSSTDVFPPRRASLDLPDLNHHDTPSEHDHPQPSSSNPDDPNHALLLAKLEAISERESESGAGSLTGKTKLSTDDPSDQAPAKTTENPSQSRKSSLPERSRTQGVPRARSKSSHSGVPRLKLDPDPPSRTSLTYRVTKK